MATTMTSLNTNLSIEEKEEFARTAAALGLTTSGAIVDAAEHVIEPVSYLSDKDYKAFVRALDEPIPRPARSLLEREFAWAD